MSTMTVETKPISRREFLYYVWGASGALAIAGACGASVWYALPARLIPENGYYHVPLSEIPTAYNLPYSFGYDLGNKTDFWLVKHYSGLVAFDPICPFHRYRPLNYKWVDLWDSFACPLCGTRYHLDGTAYYGLSIRSLDRYTIYVTTPTEHRETPANGSPVSIDGATEIIVYTRRVIKGDPRR